MPFYTYECAECGLVVEVLRNIDDRHEMVVCEKCNVYCELIIEAPSFKIREALDDRMNRNYKTRMQKKASGEW